MDVIPDIPVDRVCLNGHGHPLSEEDIGDFEPLLGTPEPMFDIRREQPWHRPAAMMFAKGATTFREVAAAFGVSPQTVSNLVRLPWFQKRVNDLMIEYGAKDIMALFKAESLNSLITLVELRDNEKAPSAVRRASAVDILDRALGKPLQRTETSEAPRSDDPVGEVRRLEEQNARLRPLS